MNLKAKFGASRAKAALSAVVAGALVATTSLAHAALDPAVAEGINQVKADASEINSLVMPVMISIFAMGLVYTLFKRFGKKI